MGRIRFITTRISLYATGYSVRLAVFNEVEVIHHLEFDRLTWRETTDLVETLVDHYRPGLELMAGGVQETLF
jgi:hypothetical protein